MQLSKTEIIYLIETLKAIQSGKSRVGVEHYTVTINSIQMREILSYLEKKYAKKLSNKS